MWDRPLCKRVRELVNIGKIWVKSIDKIPFYVWGRVADWIFCIDSWTSTGIMYE